MKIIKNLPKISAEAQSFFNMWDSNWKKLIDNPYYRLVSKLDVDLSELSIVLDCEVCDTYQEFSEKVKNYTVDKLVEQYEEYQDLISFAYKGYAEHIKSYLDAHNIQLINTGRSEWKTMRFMSHFLGDFNNDKVVFWHTRNDEESGEFVVCDLSFVKKCVENNKMPDLPNVTIDPKWEKMAKKWDWEIEIKECYSKENIFNKIVSCFPSSVAKISPEMIVSILAENPDGLTLDEIIDRVKKII